MTQSYDLVISNATIKGEDLPVDIGITGNKISCLAAANSLNAPEMIDSDEGYVSTSFTDAHFHLDKVLSRALFGADKFEDAFGKAHEVKTHFTVEDVKARAMQALKLAVCHGLGAIKAQCDVDYATGLISLEGVLAAAEEYKDLITVEAIAFPQEGVVCDPKQPELLREGLRMGAKYIGGLPEFEASGTPEDQRKHIETIFDIAEEFDVDVDCHADYTDRKHFKTLEMLADITIERGFHGRVCAGHCNALEIYPDDEAKRVIEKLVEAKIQVAVLPLANLQMLGGEKRTPYNRGSSRILELLDAGVNVASGLDNMYDIWYRFNGMDPVLLGLMTCLSGGMRTDAEVEESYEMITNRAARTMKRYDGGVAVGAPADLVVHQAKSLVDIYRMLPGRLITIKNGKKVAELNKSTTLFD
jgi:cytosine deaminase